MYNIIGMAVSNKVHKQGLQHHGLSHITIHPYIGSCKLNLWGSTCILAAAAYVGMHSYVGQDGTAILVCIATLFATAITTSF